MESFSCEFTTNPSGAIQPGFFHTVTQVSFSRVTSIVGVLGGCLVLLGWGFDIAILKTVFPGAAPMKANAALALILSGVSLWFSASDSSSIRRRIAQASAALVVSIGLFTLAEHLLGHGLVIDEILFKDPSALADASDPGRMDPGTAGLFLLLGVELALLAASVEAWIFQSIALATGVVSLLAAAGYLYGIPSLYSVGAHVSLPPPSALGLLILSLGVLCARPGTGLVSNVSGDDIGGLMAVRLLAGAVSVPLILGYATLLGQRRGLYGSEAALALFALSSVFFFAAIVIWNARSLARASSEWRTAERRARADRERMRILGESALAIASAPYSSAVRDALLEKTESLIPSAAATTVRLLDRQSGELEPAASRNRNGEEWTIDENKALGGRSKKILGTKAPVTIRNLATDGQVANQLYRKQRLASYIGVPLCARGEVLGIFGVYTAEPHEFSREEIDCLGVLAGQAALALGEARAREDAPPTKTEPAKTAPAPRAVHTQTSLNHLPELYAALAPLQTTESIGETIEGIIDRLMDATGADAALVRVWKKETGLSVVAGHRGIPDDAARQMEVGLLGGAAEWVTQNAAPILAGDIATEPRFKTKVQQQLGFRSAAVLPLKIHGDVRGILYVASRTPGRLDEKQRDLLVAIAQQMGVSMENRELIVHLKESRDEVEKVSKVKDEFLSVMSHELRTPLSVVMGYAGMIKEKMLGEINAQQEEALQKLLTRGNDQLNMINAIMQITQLESRALVLERHLVNLSEFLMHLKSDYALSHTKAQVALHWDYPSEPIAVVTDSGKLKEILVNLINNAIKFTAQGAVTVKMRLAEAHRKKWVEFAVADTGVGIDEEHQAKIFDKFYQVDSSETRLYGGLGLGLYIVKHFTEFLGGTIEVASEPGKGSTFTVMIPYAT
jgi:signal transduction histidine kinase